VILSLFIYNHFTKHSAFFLTSLIFCPGNIASWTLGTKV
jgi:hypothetical protein